MPLIHQLASELADKLAPKPSYKAIRVIAERRPRATCPDCGRTFEVRALHGLEAKGVTGSFCPGSPFE